MTTEVSNTTPTDRGTWKIRRRVMFMVMGFSVAVVCWSIWKDNKVAETAITMAFTTIMATTGSYVFGATWDDKNKR